MNPWRVQITVVDGDNVVGRVGVRIIAIGWSPTYWHYANAWGKVVRRNGRVVIILDTYWGSGNVSQYWLTYNPEENSLRSATGWVYVFKVADS